MKVSRVDQNLPPEDRAGLHALVDAVQSGTPYFDPPGSLPAASWMPAALDAASHVYLAREQDGIVGFLLAQPFTSYGKFLFRPSAYGVRPHACIYLSELGVAQTVRGKGVGRRLVDGLVAEARATLSDILVRTVHKIHGTDQRNPAIDFYLALGFDMVMIDGQPLIEDGPTLRNKPRVFLRWKP